MTSHVTPTFRRLYATLPAAVQRRARDSFPRFMHDPTQRGLNFKVVSAKHDVWSARVTDDFRVLGKRNGKTITWFWIGRHAEYDQLLNKL